jgi:hypothetical protein
MDGQARSVAAFADAGREDDQVGGLWREASIGTPRLPDPVRVRAVRAGLLVSFTLIEAVFAVLATADGSWLAAPAVLCTIVSTVVTTWAVVDVWITRQVWNQRHGVVSSPSSVARALRRERRRERRAARAADRASTRAARAGRRHDHLISRA